MEKVQFCELFVLIYEYTAPGLLNSRSPCTLDLKLWILGTNQCQGNRSEGMGRRHRSTWDFAHTFATVKLIQGLTTLEP